MSREDIARLLDEAGNAKAATQMREYDAACKWFGTTATYVSREANELHEMLDAQERPVASVTWLCESVMVAMWRALGCPRKETP